MSKSDNKGKKPQRHVWSLHFDRPEFYLDEPITGWVELVVQDVYMASTIKLSLMQFVTVTVSDKYVPNPSISTSNHFSRLTDLGWPPLRNKKVGTPLLPEPLNLLQELPRTQFCMGRHKIPFSIRPTFAPSPSSPSSDASASPDSKRATMDASLKDAERMLPTTLWNHQEDATVYSGTARSASVEVQYVLSVHSLRAVSGSVEQIVASSDVIVRQKTTIFHSPLFSGSYAPVSSRPTDTITLKAKLSQKMYCHGDTMSMSCQIASTSFEIKKIVFSLLNSTMIRDNPSDSALPALHTSAIATTELTTSIEAGKSLEKTIQLSIPDSALPRFSVVLSQPHAKVRTEVVLRITLVVEGYPDHIFQSPISIVSRPIALKSSESSTLEKDDAAQQADELAAMAAKVVLWVDDRQAARCAHCTGLFSFLHRKHHCRGCGLIVCADHSKKLSAPKLFGLKPRLVCNACQPLIASDELVSNGGVPPSGEEEGAQLPVVHIHDPTFSTHLQSIQQEIEEQSSLKLSTGVTSQPVSMEISQEKAEPKEDMAEQLLLIAKAPCETSESLA